MLVQLCLNIFYKRFDFFDLIILGFADFLDGALYFIHVEVEVLESLPKSVGFLADHLHVSLIDYTQLLKLMLLVIVAKHRTITADWLLASVAIIIESSIMLLTKFFLRLQQLLFVGLHSIDCGSYFLNKATINKLTYSQICSAMWTRLALFCQPFLQKRELIQFKEHVSV